MYDLGCDLLLSPTRLGDNAFIYSKSRRQGELHSYATSQTIDYESHFERNQQRKARTTLTTRYNNQMTVSIILSAESA